MSDAAAPAAGPLLEETQAKEEDLKRLLADYGSVAVAYSGGVDSTYLADVAHEVLGACAHLLIADSPSIPRSELDEARDLARERQWNLTIISTREFTFDQFLKNDENRCYYCKNELFAQMRRYATDHGISVLAYGETRDDILDVTRMGRLAARENAAVAPLQEAGLSKAEIRQLSARRNLPTWNKASFACLSSRIPTGTPLESSTLTRVEQAEELLKRLGFRQYRARHHEDLCRIEIATEDFSKILDPDVREKLVTTLKDLGYRYVTLDLQGYRTGSAAAPPRSSQ